MRRWNWNDRPEYRSAYRIGRLRSALLDGLDPHGAWFAVVEEKDGEWWWRKAACDSDMRPEYFGPCKTQAEAKTAAEVALRLEGKYD